MTQLTIKVVGAEMVRQGLENLRAEIPKIGKRRIYDTMLRVRARLRTSAARPSYPIQWDSERQRKAYFATRGFGAGIPYRRSGRYESGWQIAPTGTGYRIENSWSKAVYVGGDYAGQGQSNIHRGRWALFQEVVEDEITRLPPEIEKSISYYGRGLGF